MEQHPKHQPAANNRVVAELKTPKVNMSGAGVARFNAFALSFAAFFGVMSIFSAVAGMTDGSWSFSVPVIGILFSNISATAISIATAILAVLLGVLGIVTINKITDAVALKKSWECTAKIFCFISVFYLVSTLSVALYSLLGAGSDYIDHEYLWLSCFLPNLIITLMAGGMFFFANAIAKGKTELLRILSIVATVIAGLGLILILTNTLLDLYGDSSNSIDDIFDSYYDDDGSWGGFFNY